jgi:hypothetical protein
MMKLLALYAAFVAWDVFFGTLSHVPGPKLNAASNIPKLVMLWTGYETQTMLKLHEKYGPIVRTAPRQVSFTDASAWKVIYGHKTGGKTKTFVKDPNILYDGSRVNKAHRYCRRSQSYSTTSHSCKQFF